MFETLKNVKAMIILSIMYCIVQKFVVPLQKINNDRYKQPNIIIIWQEVIISKRKCAKAYWNIWLCYA